MKYWIFKTNPDKFDLEKRLADPQPRTTWRVPRYRKEVETDHIAFIWQTGLQRGIRATVRIDSSPQEMQEIESERPYLRTPITSPDIRVYASFLRRDLDLPAQKLRSTPGLEGLSVFHMVPRGTVYPVTAEEAAILLRLIE